VPGTKKNEGNEESLATISVLKKNPHVIHLHLPRKLVWPCIEKKQISSIKPVKIIANVTQKDSCQTFHQLKLRFLLV
jgi:hypothetical protein